MPLKCQPQRGGAGDLYPAPPGCPPLRSACRNWNRSVVGKAATLSTSATMIDMFGELSSMTSGVNFRVYRATGFWKIARTLCSLLLICGSATGIYVDPNRQSGTWWLARSFVPVTS